MTSNNLETDKMLRGKWLLRGKWIAVLVLAAVLSACGGGGGGLPNVSGGSSGSSGSSSSGGNTIAGPANNVASTIVDSGPVITAADGCNSTADQQIGGCVVGQTAGSLNTTFVSVTICVPGTTNCQTIDHVAVDTGSPGMRIISSALTPSFLAALPAGTNNAGKALSECLQFGSGYMWGSVRNVDIHIATTGSPSSEEVASAMNIQIAGDLPAALGPTQCTSLPSYNDVYAAGQNGILGVGLFVNDCITGQTCPAGVGNLQYLNCPAGAASTSCTEVSVETNHQVSNPVASLLASDAVRDNTGVILELPAVNSATGAATNSGALVFGIGTRSNNSLTTQLVVVADPSTGNMSAELSSPTNYGGTGLQAYSQYSFFDSGSTAILIPGTTIPCDAYGFIPSSTLAMTAKVQGAGNSTSGNPVPLAGNFSFQIGNAITLLSTGNAAFDDLAAPALATPCTGSSGGLGFASGPDSGIDFGLPAFMGRNMYVGLETAIVVSSGGTTYYGPLWAF